MSAGLSSPITAVKDRTMSWMLLILAITVIASYQAFNRPTLKEQLLYHPYRVKTFQEWHRIVTHAFVHADFTHLALNAFVLFQFGAWIEALMQQTLGPAYFRCCTSEGGVCGDSRYDSAPRQSKLPKPRCKRRCERCAHRLYPAFPHRGTAAILCFALARVCRWHPVFVYEHQMDKRSKSNIAHDAHLWGGLYGLLFTVATAPQVVPAFFGALSAYLGF